MIDTDVDCLIETLKQLIDFNCPSHISKSPWILKERDRFEWLYKDLTSLRTFLSCSEETRYTVPEVKALVIRIIDLASKVEDMVDSFVSSFAVKNPKDFNQDPCLDLDDVNHEIQVIKGEMESANHEAPNVLKDERSASRVNVTVPKEDKIVGFDVDFDQDPCFDFDGIMQEIQAIKGEMEFANHEAPNVLKDEGSSSRVNIAVPKEEKIVGFDVETREILDTLVGDQKKLDVISIVGMGGLGKTTLAKRAYYDSYVTYHFYIRGWVTVSQTYQKLDLLLSLCNSLSIEPGAGEKNIGKLCELIYKRLKGKRYLIVIDDIWSAEAWNEIRICFPDDNLGSRILVTSRLMNVASNIKQDSPIHRLRFLTVEESWDLLRHKVFAEDGTCPTNLQETGKQIAERCRGLPLAILVISGLLAKTEKSVEFWTQVLDSIGSYIVSDSEQCMNTLSLSYNHLPRHLKSCFLYFGAFKEDFEINVRKLMWLWVAEGFVKPGTENAAEEYLVDLIDRSLVMVDQKRSNGGVKVCRVHDLLHDLCLKKSKEEKFLCEIKVDPFLGLGFSTNTTVRRSFIHNHVLDYVFSKPFSPSTRSFLFFLPAGLAYAFTKENMSFIYSAFKHIRVLELKSVVAPFLPTEIGQLVQLRYLSLNTQEPVIPESLSNLWNLQTLVVYAMTCPVAIDFQVCKENSLSNLRHICIWPSLSLRYPVASPKVQTISNLRLPFGRQPVLEMAPNLKKLACVVSQQQHGLVPFPPLDTLVHLEKLKIHIDNDLSLGFFPEQARFTCLNRLPHTLKKVTFSNCYLPWKDLSEFGRLPNLEILKLLRGSFQGPRWDPNDGEFKKLKVLKIQSPELAEWNMSSDHFPALEKLVMDGCRQLKEIPMCLGEIPTMGLIELRWPRSSAADSARRIIEEQQSLGNDWLKLVIYDRMKGRTLNFEKKLFSEIEFGYTDSSEDSESTDDSTKDKNGGFKSITFYEPMTLSFEDGMLSIIPEFELR
ncbi:putative virus X resistance protein-like, coiled-coil [Helianthus annuus]|uniref:Virus X resistance protein-like, coiled-coil n=2 Tax=Helianthus annuus TaxID=4232 RepID=A0A9K3DF53_HELAN|nr:putative virus X resistance protein-like, coiled-coil [Helianthus annuus]KAJ0811825.1 putative virus X resistance protein-like, coiled-coil [Helianthus annuus]